MKSSLFFASVSCLALVGAFPAPAIAQESAASGEDQTSVLETVVVTSTKRAENQQDVGLTVQTLSGNDIRDLGVDNLEDVMNLVPGTGFLDSAGGGIPIVVIRGVGLQNFRINDTPTTAIYVDEIYQTSVAQAVSTLFDVERVEVLKGPQGGLYGRNAVGGAIQIISARPDFDGFGGSVSARYEEYERFEGEAVVTGPLSDTLAFRLGGKVIQSGDGYFHSTTGNFDHGAEDRWAARGLLEWRPSSTANVLFKLHGGGDQSDLPLGHATGFYQPLGLNLGAVTGVTDTADGAILNAQAPTASINSICTTALSGGRAPELCETLNGMTPDELGFSSRYDSASLSQPVLDNSWWGASVQADFTFGAFTLTSISAYDDFEHSRYIDQDAMPEIHQEIDYGSVIEAWSQEVRLSYDDGGVLTWIVGANYAEDELTEDSVLLTETGILRTQLGGLTQAGQQYVQTTDAFAVYGRADWDFAEQLSLVLEARYTEEEKGFDGSTFLPQVGATLASADESTTFDALSGKIAVEYTPTDNALLYMSYSEGFKSGGYFGGFATSNAQLQPFDNETITAYEAGFKTDWPAQAFRLNGSVFFYDRKDVQANGLDTSGIVSIARLTNVGDVEAYGAELESVWAPTPQLTFQVGIAWLETEIVSSDKTTSNIFRSSTTESFVGARLANQPEFSANLVSRYEQSLTPALLGSLQLDITYRGEQDLSLLTNRLEAPLLTEDAYTLVNLKASVGPDDRRWSVYAYANNLFDEVYRQNATGSAPAGFVEIYGAPQILGVGLDFEF